ncbi:glycerophosphodiester phosphodiesterase family protein [Ornithinimicrobium murale]|uniref:glycerophosphodiester phosphodiesterase family protein n=1 Tax=Ornithinimicrobium murale TaxID=1050153 RepID=UPI001EE0EFCD|nr:glycerophosphodiester phosphodiesterase family protein [Ornithinimicrobium murale]
MTRTAYLDHPGPLPLAHRGFDRLGLENSMPAFQAAIDLGYRHLETDVHATSDGVLLAFHDVSLDRVTDQTGQIPRLPWEQVSRAKIGGAEQIPRLEVMLHAWPHARFNIDIKSAGAIGPLVRVIERARAHHRVCVTSFSDARRREALRRLTRPVVTSAGQGSTARFRLAVQAGPGLRERRVAAALRDADGLQVPVAFRGIPVVTARTVAAAHAAGKFVHVWTINEASEMHRLLDLGVDGLVTDRADVLKEVLTERGQWF